MIRVVAAAIVEEGRLLVAKRASSGPLPGLWELPGGKVEDGEEDAVALAREIREELAVDVAVEQRVGVSPHEEICLVAYRCRIRSGRPQARVHSELRWVEPDDIDGLSWAPADVPLLDVLQRSARGAGKA